MASPFYTPIRVNQSDFSPITRGAESYGRSVGAGLEKLGDAVGKVASSYFEKKKFEGMVEKMANDPMVNDYLSSMGKEFEDEGSKGKFLKEMMNELGGPENFRNHLQTQLQYQASEEKQRQTTTLFNQQRRQNSYLIAGLESKDKLQKQTLGYMKHLNTENKNGVFNRDADDPTGGFDTSSPEAMQAVMAVNEKMGLGRYNPSLVGKMSDSLAPVDEITGEQLPHKNYLSEADMYKHIDQVKASPFGRSVSPEIMNAFVERQKANIDGAGDKPFAREIFKTELAASGFGAYAEAAKTNAGTMGNFRGLLDESLVTLDDGTVDIKNPVAASVALMQLARMAQGAGVLSNQDVNLIKGDQSLAASWERLISKNIGETVDLTEEMIAQNPAWTNSINPDTGEVFQVGDPVTLGGANLSAADLKMFQSLADKLDDRSNEFTKKVIPDIYKNVRATYGGFTIDQLNQFTDLHQYMPNGIVNLNPMSQVTTKQMDAVVNMMKDGMTESEAKNFIRQNSMGDPNTEYDEDTDGKAIDAMVDSVYNKGYRSRHNAHVQTFNDQAQYQGKQRKVQPPKVDMPENLDDSGNAVKNIGYSAATGSLMKGADIAKRAGLKSQIAKDSFPYKKQALSRIKDLSGKDLKNTAKEFGVKGADKMSDKAIKKQITTRIKQEVKQEVKEKLIAMGAKKKVFSALTKLMASGTVGSVMFVMDLVQADTLPKDAKLSVLKDAVNKAKKGSPEREIAQEMFDRAYYTDSRNIRPTENQMGIKDRKRMHIAEQYGL